MSSSFLSTSEGWFRGEACRAGACLDHCLVEGPGCDILVIALTHSTEAALITCLNVVSGESQI